MLGFRGTLDGKFLSYKEAPPPHKGPYNPNPIRAPINLLITRGRLLV